MMRGVLRTAARSVTRMGSSTSPQTFATRSAVLTASERFQERQYRQQATAISALGLAVAITVAATANDDSNTLLEAKQLTENGLMTVEVGEGEETNARPRVGRRLLLKQRSKHQAKQEEVGQMKTHLDEYKQRREAIGSLRARFDMYASKSVVQSDGRSAKAMTFTDFLHSFVLPQFHLHAPRPDLVYSCDFVGDANGLITYEECYLLIHLLQIPKEHFNVAFYMFDLDGDGSVDKAEFCAVIGNLLRTITLHEVGEEVPISAEDTLPRLTKYLFGRFSQAITAKDLETALDLLREQILRAEFDLYATVNPVTRKSTMSVHDFALTLVSCFDPEKLPPYLDRVQTLSASDGVVKWEEFFAFHFNVQGNLADIKLAFELTGAEEITEAEFIRAAHVVTGVELSSPVVQLAFRVFDDNANGTLDQSELFKVLEMRNTVQLKQVRGANS
ncbi:hypothetical protein BBJ29_002850 [Phytophthora kernoviae]|uniref:EF-hand domain-containing protein n=1 Tax=Phytophthora kernoviae TaxID=325452 RepID=A0A3F2RNI0_9STRA|nr:hypothetical protein BBP00_00005579 [Phytophthora kernoviae]RLN65046.1 hypothetical protein BBJ29_002850 [Phytophthora kernoviae]